MEHETKRRLRRWLSVSVRLYAIAIVGLCVYGSIWLLDVAGLVDRQPVEAAWFAVAALGVVFAALLLPIFRESRRRSR